MDFKKISLWSAAVVMLGMLVCFIAGPFESRNQNIEIDASFFDFYI